MFGATFALIILPLIIIVISIGIFYISKKKQKVNKSSGIYYIRAYTITTRLNRLSHPQENQKPVRFFCRRKKNG